MADPRAEALLRSLSGGGDAADPMAGMEPEGAMEQSDPKAQAVGEALSLLEPFMDDPNISQAAQILQQAAAGPEEMPSDSQIPEGAEPMPQLG